MTSYIHSTVRSVLESYKKLDSYLLFYSGKYAQSSTCRMYCPQTLTQYLVSSTLWHPKTPHSISTGRAWGVPSFIPVTLSAGILSCNRSQVVSGYTLGIRRITYSETIVLSVCSLLTSRFHCAHFDVQSYVLFLH